MALHLISGSPGDGMSFDLSFDVDWGCFGKQPFSSRHDAEKSIRRLKRSIQRHRSRGRCESYRCPKCGSWHVGAGL